ncbi:hypothetical protein M758_2G224200 [Ceratodon purpureus]|nr:hypothetical protein M758_2G224200 [Ceratodon purpureus]
MGPKHVTKRVAVAGSSRSDGKRKWREPRNRDVTTGSRAASSSCRSDYMGVRNRGFAVEIKRWYEGRLDFYKDVKMSEGEAAMVHDLARLYLDINWERLNIETLVFRMQEEDPALTGFGEAVHIGKEFLISFVEKHPIAQVESCTPKERVDSMKEAIIALPPEAFKGLKKEIADKLSRAGCYRKETEEFFPAVEYNDLLEDLKVSDLEC